VLARDLLDRAIANGVVRENLASTAAIAHARLVQARGRQKSSLGMLLVELEHVAEGDMERLVRALPDADDKDVAAATGTLDDVVTPGDMPNVLERFARDMRAVPLTAAEELHRRQQNERFWARANDGSETLLDPPFVRFANLLLFQWVTRRPGQCVRFELGQTPAIRAGDQGIFDQTVDLALPGGHGREALTLLSWRYKEMASVAPGPGPRRGMIRLMSRQWACDIALDITRTDRGDVMLLRRFLPWTGSNWPEGAAFEPWRDAMNAAIEARDQDDLRAGLDALQRAHEAARALGEDGVIELLNVSAELADALYRAARHSEARAVAEEAIGIARTHGLGPRCEAELTVLLAVAREEEHDASIALLHEAVAAFDRPGPQRGPWFSWTNPLPATERLAGRPADAIVSALRVEREAIAWYGAHNDDVYEAWISAILSHLDLGDSGAARALTKRQHELGRALQLGHADAIAYWHEGRALSVEGAPERALPVLETANEAYATAIPGSDGLPQIEADIAIALARLGRTSEAHARASKVLPKLPSGVVTREVQQILGRGGPFR
jgi:tetratricopeptide (TPR) repeat protein